MATVIESSGHNTTEHRPYFSAIRWTAIFGGLVAGLSSYILLALFGVAIGLTAIDPADAELGAVPAGTGIWSGISMLIAGFIGAHVAARMSGLTRKGDGLLHGFVTWGATTLLLAWIATSTVSALFGGTLGLAGQAIQGAAGGQQQGIVPQSLEVLITGSAEGEINPEDVQALQNQLQAGNRQGAIDVMVNRMGFEQQRANQVVDQAMALFGPGAGQQVEQAAEQAVNSLTAVSWWLFIGLILSVAAALWGGLVGIRPNSRRTTEDHTQERHHAAGAH